MIIRFDKKLVASDPGYLTRPSPCSENPLTLEEKGQSIQNFPAKALIDQLAEGVLLFDENLVLTTWNTSLAQRFPALSTWPQDKRLSDVIKLPDDQSIDSLFNLWLKGVSTTGFCEFRQNISAYTYHISFCPLHSEDTFCGLMAKLDPSQPQLAGSNWLTSPDWAPAILDNLRDSVIITEPCLTSPGPRMCYVNKAFTEMTGYSRDEVIGKTPRILQGSATDSTELHSLKDALIRDEYFKSETTNYRKNGEPFILQWEVMPVKGEAGQVQFYVAIQRDVTAYRKLQNDTRFAVNNYRAVLEQSAVPMGVFQNGKAMQVNPALAKLLAYTSPDEMAGLSVDQLLRPDYLERAKHRHQYLQIHGGEVEPNEGILLARDGREVPVLVTGLFCYYRAEPAIQVIIQDISERKAAEQALRQQEAQFRRIADNIREAIFLLSPSTLAFEYASPAALEVLTYEEDQLLEVSLYDLVPAHEEGRMQAVHTQLQQGCATSRMTYHFITGRGEVRVMRGYFLPIQDDNGTVTQVQGIARDITEEQKQEALLQETQEIASVGGWQISQNDLTISNKVYDLLERPYHEPLSLEEAITYYIPDHQPILQNALDELWNHGKAFTHELKAQTPSGQRWVRVKGQPYYTNGTFYQIGGIVQDITEQKEARKDRDRFFAHSVELMAVVKGDYAIRVNKRWEQVTGWSQQAFLQYPFESFIHPDYRAYSREMMQALVQNGSVDPFINCMICRDGSYRWIEGYGVLDEEEGTIYAFARDVTEETEAKRNLKESEQKFRTFAEQSQIGIFFYQDGRVVYVNPKMETISGYTANELLSMDPFTIVADEQREDVRAKVSDQVAKGKDHVNYSYQLEGRNGQRRDLEVLTSLFRYNDRPAILASVMDTTNQNAIFHQLRESQYFNEKLAQTSPNLIVIFDYTTMTYTYANGKMQELLGHTLKALNNTQDGLTGMMDPEDQAKSRRIFQENRQLADGAMNQCEVRVRTRDRGSYRWFLVIDTPFKRNANGELTQVLSTFQDITEQKAREQQLKDQQQFIEDIARNSPGFINIYDYETEIFVYENHPVFSYLGYDAPYQDSRYPYFHPDDRERIAAFNEENLKLEDGAVNAIEYRMQHRDGHYRWFHNRDVVHKRDKAGNVKQVLGLITDVTAEKEMEESLRRSAEYYRQLFQNTPVGIVMLDLDYCLVSCNEGFTELFGYTQADVEGQVLDRFIVPDELKAEGKGLADRPLFGETVTQETTRLDKHGNAIPVLVYGFPIFFEGEPLNLYGMYIDLSERKKAEDDLRQQTQALLRSNAELQQFAYITSHHLRSPIINLQSLLELFDTQELNDPENQYILRKLTESSDELSHTLNDLTHIVGRKEQLSKPKVTLSFQQVFDEATDQLRPVIDQTGAEVSADFTEAPRICYLQTFLTSICYHLLSNALRFRNPERVPRIHVQTTRYGSNICLSITDNGVGIDLERNGNRIFELYQGAHDGHSGKGMGLYLVKYQVEALEGSISVDSEVGNWTTFYVYLKDFEPGDGS